MDVEIKTSEVFKEFSKLKAKEMLKVGKIIGIVIAVILAVIGIGYLTGLGVIAMIPVKYATENPPTIIDIVGTGLLTLCAIFMIGLVCYLMFRYIIFNFMVLGLKRWISGNWYEAKWNVRQRKESEECTTK
jgi:hypothetical protein